MNPGPERDEVADLLARRAENKARIRNAEKKYDRVKFELNTLEEARIAMARRGDQAAVLSHWRRLAKLYNLACDFPEDAPAEDYVLDLVDFKRWSERNELTAENFNEHASGTIFHYSNFESVRISDSLEIAGLSWWQGGDRPTALVHGMFVIPVEIVPEGKLDDLSVKGEEVGTTCWPVVFHVGDRIEISTDAPGDVAHSKEVREDLSALLLLYGRARDYVAAATFEVVERRPPKPGVLEKAGFKKRAQSPRGPVAYRVIRSVRRIYKGEPRNSFSWSAPSHRVAVSGFWRKCKGLGRDAEGRPVLGKTWVRGHTRWNDKPEDTRRVVWVKEPLARPEESNA